MTPTEQLLLADTTRFVHSVSLTLPSGGHGVRQFGSKIAPVLLTSVYASSQQNTIHGPCAGRQQSTIQLIFGAGKWHEHDKEKWLLSFLESSG